MDGDDAQVLLVVVITHQSDRARAARPTNAAAPVILILLATTRTGRTFLGVLHGLAGAWAPLARSPSLTPFYRSSLLIIVR